MAARDPDNVYEINLTSKTGTDGTSNEVTTAALDDNLVTQHTRITKNPEDCLKLFFSGDKDNVAAGDTIGFYAAMSANDTLECYIYDTSTTIKTAGMISVSTDNSVGWKDVTIDQNFVDNLVDLGGGDWAIRFVPSSFADRYRITEVQADISEAAAPEAAPEKPQQHPVFQFAL